MADRCMFTKYIPDPTPDPDFFANGDLLCLGQVSGNYEMFTMPLDLSAIAHVAQASGVSLSMAGQSDRRPWIESGEMHVPRGSLYNEYDKLDITTGVKSGAYTLGHTSSVASDPLASVRDFKDTITYTGDSGPTWLIDEYKGGGTKAFFDDGVLSEMGNENQIVYNQQLGTKMVLINSPLRLESFEDGVGFTGITINIDDALTTLPYSGSVNDGYNIELTSDGVAFMLAYKNGSDATLCAMDLPLGSGSATMRNTLVIPEYSAALGYGAYDLFFYGINFCDGQNVYLFNRSQSAFNANYLCGKFDKDLNEIAVNRDLINGGVLLTRIMAAGQYI